MTDGFDRMIARDVPDYLKKEIYSGLGNHTVCFLKPDDDNKLLLQCGSGTLVHHQGVFGILTAGHVVRVLERLPTWSLGLPRLKMPMVVNRRSVGFARTPTATIEAEGPDLGFVRLEPEQAAFVASVSSPVDLAFHKARLKAAEEFPLDDGFWVEVGFPAEYGSGSRDDVNRIVTVTVKCVSFLGGVDSRIERGRFDYYDASVRYDGADAIPLTFRGMSGGGLWFIRVVKKADRFEVFDRYFSGVVFYELANDGTVSAIRSHGRKSVYDYAVDELIPAAF